MNVLRVSPYYQSRSDPTNGLFIRDQALALRSHDFKTRVIYTPRWLPGNVSWDRVRGSQSRSDRYEHDGIDTLVSPTPILPRHVLLHHSGALAMMLLRRQLAGSAFLDGVDLVHGHDLFPAGQLASLLASELGVPFILTIHGEDGTGGTYRTNTRRAAIAQIFGVASRVILVGHKLCALHEELGLSSSKYVVIPNGITPVADVVAERPPNWRDKFMVVSVSNLYDSKGIGDNLSALRTLVERGIDDILYVIVGDGHHRRRFQAMARSFQVQDHVYFAGRVDHSMAMSYIAMSDLFSLPSYNEAFGNVYLEAMLQGKPVIGVAGQGPSDIVNSGTTGFLVNCHAPLELARLWEELYADSDLRVQVGANARQVVQERFSWDTHASAVARVYEEALRC